MSETSDGEWLLRPLRVPGLPPFITITADGVTLGREAHCTHAIGEDDFPYVSSEHARFMLMDGKPFVEDMGSRNGTLVNGRKVDRRELKLGDIIQLGDPGPRFAAVNAANAHDTLPSVGPPPASASALGDTMVNALADRIGEKRRESVARQIRSSSRRMLWIAIILAAVVTGGIVGGAMLYYEPPEPPQNDALMEMNEELQRQLAAQQLRLEEQQAAMTGEKQRLEQERAALSERLVRLEADERANEGEVERLRTQLAGTQEKLALFDPVKLRQAQLAGVRKSYDAVVLVEFRSVMRETRSQKLLHVYRDHLGRPIPNLDGRGELFTNESSGSGFCVSADGHVFTNAHVARPEGGHGRVKGPGGLTFTAEPEVNVVFTGTSKRIPAKLVKIDDSPTVDLAVVKIEPFEGMPLIADFSLETPIPDRGDEVYLFGFPLGKIAMQEGDTVVASTFKGILSRGVGDFLQVDAGVHPGNSGGPVTDQLGRVIGIVSRVQITPDGDVANAIGYVIPLETLGRTKMWPLD